MSAVILDISRLISRVRYSTPSGVDRVEMAYARGLMQHYGLDLAFAAVHPTGRYGRIDHAVALEYLQELERRWGQEDGRPAQLPITAILPWMARLLPRRGAKAPVGQRPVYVQVSPHHLTRQDKMRRIIEAEQARFLCMVHDLIPIEFPEYARPGGAQLHRRRIESIVSLADAVIVNSSATGRSLQPWIEHGARQITTHVALLGTEELSATGSADTVGDKPYFICLGTIEGRKNHLLLLNLWRQMVQTLPADDVPRLVIVGKRGWENEQVLSMLDRCSALSDHVEEIGGCSDARLAGLMRKACALLMPSFAEGYGMPVAEALSVGLPVICSDIDAHHEVGGNVPDFVDPLDAMKWRKLVLDYACDGPARMAQLERITQWRKPGWDEHMRIVVDAISQLAAKE